MTKHEQEIYLFYFAVAVSLLGLGLIVSALTGIVGADITMAGSEIAAIKSLALFGGGMIVAAMILWSMLFQRNW